MKDLSNLLSRCTSELTAHTHTHAAEWLNNMFNNTAGFTDQIFIIEIF